MHNDINKRSFLTTRDYQSTRVLFAYFKHCGSFNCFVKYELERTLIIDYCHAETYGGWWWWRAFLLWYICFRYLIGSLNRTGIRCAVRHSVRLQIQSICALFSNSCIAWSNRGDMPHRVSEPTLLEWQVRFLRGKLSEEPDIAYDDAIIAWPEIESESEKIVRGNDPWCYNVYFKLCKIGLLLMSRMKL